MSHCEGVKRPKQSLGVLEFSPILALGILEFLGFKLSCLSLVGRWLAFYCRKPKGQRKFRIPVIASKAKQSLGILKFSPELEFPRNSKIP